jgi:hypothetical protein
MYVLRTLPLVPKQHKSKSQRRRQESENPAACGQAEERDFRPTASIYYQPQCGPSDLRLVRWLCHFVAGDGRTNLAREHTTHITNQFQCDQIISSTCRDNQLRRTWAPRHHYYGTCAAVCGGITMHPVLPIGTVREYMTTLSLSLGLCQRPVQQYQHLEHCSLGVHGTRVQRGILEGKPVVK